MRTHLPETVLLELSSLNLANVCELEILTIAQRIIQNTKELIKN